MTLELEIFIIHIWGFVTKSEEKRRKYIELCVFCLYVLASKLDDVLRFPCIQGMVFQIQKEEVLILRIAWKEHIKFHDMKMWKTIAVLKMSSPIDVTGSKNVAVVKVMQFCS